MTTIYPKWIRHRDATAEEAFHSITASSSLSLPEEKEEVVVRGLDTVIIACPGGDQWYIKSNCLAGYNEMVIMIETRDLAMRRDKCGGGYYKKSTICFICSALVWNIIFIWMLFERRTKVIPLSECCIISIKSRISNVEQIQLNAKYLFVEILHDQRFGVSVIPIITPRSITSYLKQLSSLFHPLLMSCLFNGIHCLLYKARSCCSLYSQHIK